MQKILIATHNQGKLKEIGEYLKDLPVEFVSLNDLGIVHEVHEDGDTYQHNSQKKAVEYAFLAGIPAISDDGGLEIDALNGEPGVQSRYWAGPEGKDEDIVEKMKIVAKQLPEDNRKAKFRVVLSLALPTGEVWSIEDTVSGEISKEPLIELMKGFPYRSFFYLPDIHKFYHEVELTEEEKKEYNHRYKAIQKLRKIIQEKLSL
ncbi:MAG TPA: non-canonical purine NTP pyrophosphatase [Patescibacteria group bacterium]|nr:non-canonical purine NTP pyrophosphatase [Patescibacteria group bacterium]